MRIGRPRQRVFRRIVLVPAVVLAALVGTPVSASASTAVDLGTLPGYLNSRPTGVNDDGIIVGYTEYPGQRAVRWDRRGRITDLGTLGGSYSQAVGINARGTVVGHAATADGMSRAVRWDPAGRITVLDLLPGGTGGAVIAINDDDMVTGHADAADGISHPVRWDRAGRITNLGTLAGGGRSEAFLINDRGVVVGVSGTADGRLHATVWR